MNKKRLGAVGALSILLVAVLSGCAALGQFGGDVTRAFQGVSATMSTYDADGALVDQVTGESFQVARDTEFDTSDGEGGSNADSSVMQISLGNAIIRHVGSTMIIAQDGVIQVSGAPGQIRFTNDDPGVPWINQIFEDHQNLWRGTGKTLMIRSQLGKPIAVFAGNQVEVFATDVPKSTAFRVDGKYLFVYRADFTVYENSLLGN